MNDLFDYGTALKDAGQEKVAQNNSAFISAMHAEAICISTMMGAVTSDDLRLYAKMHGLIPTHPAAWGSIFRGKHWKQIGWTKSTLASNHARTIRVWTYV